MNTKVMTCEGKVVDFNTPAECLIVPLGRIKRYEYCEIFGHEIPIFFRETFTKKYFLYRENKSAEIIEFTVWQSQGVE